MVTIPIIFRLVGFLLILFSLSLVLPLIISLYYNDGAHYAFIASIICILLAGIMLATLPAHHRGVMRVRDGLLVTIFSWLSLAVCGSLVFIFAPQPLSIIDAWFESMSGLTTTGATVIERIESLPISILFYRQFLQWIGGMGLIILAVAVMPLLGVGGLQLYRTEFPGPVKDNKLTPRITETAKLLWVIYIVLTLACMFAYWLAGMTPFDAITHSFTTVSIGGFSTHSGNFGYFNSPAVQLVAIVFMLLSAMNFALHFHAWRLRNLSAYGNDPEWRFFVAYVVTILILAVAIWLPNISGGSDLIATLFQTVSIITTTGFTLENYNGFSSTLLLFLFIFACIGCCAGSTGGGIKMMRFLLLIKQGHRECKRVVHPHGVFNVRLGSSVVSDRILESVWGFFSIYLVCFAIVMGLLVLVGTDHATAWSATVATINNLGPGLGEVAGNYSSLGVAQKSILSISMLVGRLEVFTFVVLLLPIAWR